VELYREEIKLIGGLSMKVLYEMQQGDLKTVVKVEDGNVVNETTLATKGLSSSLVTKVDSDYFLDKLAEAIPGTLDDALISMLKAALKKL
jgi:hypothetical protein